MAKVRKFDFTVGVETSTAPSASVPTVDDDVVTKGFADDNYVQGAQPVADITALKAVAAADRKDNDLRFVDAENAIFFFDSASAATGDDITIVAPDAGTGRWIRVGQSLRVGNQNEVRFHELISNGSNYTSVKAAALMAGNVDWTLPDAQGAAGQFLSNDGAGVLSWASPTGGGALTTDLQSANTTVSLGTTLSHSQLTIDTGFVYTITGSLVGIGTLTVDGTLTVNSGAEVIYV